MGVGLEKRVFVANPKRGSDQREVGGFKRGPGKVMMKGDLMGNVVLHELDKFTGCHDLDVGR